MVLDTQCVSDGASDGVYPMVYGGGCEMLVVVGDYFAAGMVLNVLLYPMGYSLLPDDT